MLGRSWNNYALKHVIRFQAESINFQVQLSLPFVLIHSILIAVKLQFSVETSERNTLLNFRLLSK